MIYDVGSGDLPITNETISSLVIQSTLVVARLVDGAVDGGLRAAAGRADEPLEHIVEEPRGAVQDGLVQVSAQLRAHRSRVQAVRVHVLDVILLDIRKMHFVHLVT